MKKLIIIASLFTGLLVYAQTQSENPLQVLQKKVHCGSAKEVIGELMNGNYKEKPFWMGDEPGTNSKYVLMVNERSKSWTMLQYDGDTACIIGAGEKHKQVFHGPEI